MTNHPSTGDPEPADQDPFAAFGYLVAGVGFYGLVGWGLGRWLHVSLLTPIGIVVGLLFAFYMVFARYRYRDPTTDRSITHTPIDNDHAPGPPADRDDRGEAL